MRPCSSKNFRAELKDEINRLYFVCQYEGNNRGKLKLMFKEDYKENANYVIRLKGDPSGLKFCNLKLIRGPHLVDCVI